MNTETKKTTASLHPGNVPDSPGVPCIPAHKSNPILAEFEVNPRHVMFGDPRTILALEKDDPQYYHKHPRRRRFKTRNDRLPVKERVSADGKPRKVGALASASPDTSTVPGGRRVE